MSPEVAELRSGNRARKRPMLGVDRTYEGIRVKSMQRGARSTPAILPSEALSQTSRYLRSAEKASTLY